jgi:hypothetical protein
MTQCAGQLDWPTLNTRVFARMIPLLKKLNLGGNNIVLVLGRLKTCPTAATWLC